MNTSCSGLTIRAPGAYVLISVLLLPFWPLSKAAADATTLFGIQGFRIEVGKISKTARALGFDEVQLRILIRERLVRAAVPVGDFPTVLHVSLHTIAHSTTILAYCLDVEVRQVVQLKRTKQMAMLAPTWAEGSLTMVTRASFAHSVSLALTSLVDELIRDYRLVNADSSPTQ